MNDNQSENQIISSGERMLLPAAFLLIIVMTVISKSPARILLLAGALLVCIMKILTFMLMNRTVTGGDKSADESPQSHIEKIIHRINIITYIIAMLLILAGLIWMCYTSVYYHASDNARTLPYHMAAEDAGNISVTQSDKWIAFEPSDPVAGIIIYPGAKVEKSAYNPLLYKFSQDGFLAIIVQMPDNLAIFGKDMADQVIAAYPQIDRWYMAGHSMGGFVAAGYAAEHADTIEGMILMGSYSVTDISSLGLKVLSIYGSEDAVMGADSYNKYHINLPSDTTEIEIRGGCHAFFGNYGQQKGDGNPSITADEQMDITAKAVKEFIKGN